MPLKSVSVGVVGTFSAIIATASEVRLSFMTPYPETRPRDGMKVTYPAGTSTSAPRSSRRDHWEKRGPPVTVKLFLSSPVMS